VQEEQRLRRTAGKGVASELVPAEPAA
jgi:hypothetical protein